MRVSMDGRGRAKDNIWIERFWKTIKYEYIYILPEERDTILLFIRNSKRGIIRGIGSDVKGRAGQY